MPPSRADIERSLDEVTRPALAYICALHASIGGQTEVRIVSPGRVWSARIGPGDIDAVIDALRPVTATPRPNVPRDDYPRAGELNVYVTLGAIRVGAPGNVGLPIRRAFESAKDCDVVGSPWLVVDVDPERDPKGRSATDVEKAAARDVADRVREAFRERGVPSALADSGNGWHVLVRTLPAIGDAVSQHAIQFKALLAGLEARFSTPAAKVDKGIHNPSRIIKLYGTPSAKGNDTPEAPHRLSHLDVTSLPEEIDPWPFLADLMQVPGTSPPGPATPMPERSSRPANPVWDAWRKQALSALNLEQVYGDWLTGKVRRGGWRECRDPWSPSGDKNPSAGVMDNTGQAERGTFHSFRTSESISVFDFLVRQGQATDFTSACAVVADWTGIALPACARPKPLGDVDGFAAAWSAATTDQRTELLAETLRRIVDSRRSKRRPCWRRCAKPPACPA